MMSSKEVLSQVECGGRGYSQARCVQHDGFDVVRDRENIFLRLTSFFLPFLKKASFPSIDRLFIFSI